MHNTTTFAPLRKTNPLFRAILPVAITLFSLASPGYAQTTTALPSLLVKPNSLFFRQTGSVTPPAQTLNVNVKTGTLGALTVTASGGSWLTATASGSTVSVSVNTTSLASGKYTGSVGIAAAGFLSASVPVSLTLTGNNVVVFPNTFSLSAQVGGQADPKPHSVAVYNLIGSPFSWTATSDQTWLEVNTTSGTGTSVLTFVVDPTKITAAGTLTGHITVTDTTNSTSATITVNVTASAPAVPNFQMGPYLNVPGVLNFTADTNLSTPAPKFFYGRNLGAGGSLSFTLTGTVNSPANGNWLSFTPATNMTPGLTIVSVHPAGLAPGNYSATITGVAQAPAGITGGNLTDQLTVYLKVLQNPAIHLSTKFLRFTSSTTQTPPSPSPLSQTVTFETRSTTGYPFTATAATASGGSWLSVSPSSGTATNGGTITVSVIPSVIASLTPGFYTGEVQVNFSGGAPTAQRTIGVGLRIYGPTDLPRLRVSPGALVFVTSAGGTSPAAKNLNVIADAASSAGLAFTVSSAVSTPADGTWLSTGLASGVATSTPTAVPVSINSTGLKAGLYAGTVTLTPAPSSNAAVLIVNVYLIVAPSGITPTSNGSTMSYFGTGADARQAEPQLASTLTLATGPLVATITDPPDDFTGSTDSAIDINVLLLDAWGNAVPGATVTLSSSNGEPDVTLDDLGNGNYSGLFQPAVSGTVTLTVSAQVVDSTGTLFQSSPAAVSGDIESASDVATPVYTNGAVGAASYAPQPTPITPGGLVSLFGVNIAGSGGTASSVPLPAGLGGATVTIGGIAAPLSGAFPATTPGGLDQINLQVPFGLDGQADADIVVTSGDVIGAPQTVTLGAAPAFFTQNGAGTGDGAFVHTDGVTLITPANPAAAGEVIVLYATGLGDVQTAVPSGSAATAADSVTGSIRVTIGGIPAAVMYAGLAPGNVGEYQLNVTVPSGLPTGENNVIVFLNGTLATGRATVALH